MLLDFKERLRKADPNSTIQFKVEAQIFERFSALFEHYKYTYGQITNSPQSKTALKGIRSL